MTQLADRIVLRLLDQQRDLALVGAFYHRAADYVRLETGRPPDAETLADFFTGAPPGLAPEAALRVGLFLGSRLAGIAEMAFGYPEPADAYIGLMLLDPAARGRGLGRHLLGHLSEAARSRAAARLLVAVLDDNPRGRAFWERAGFRLVLTLPNVARGDRVHRLHRMQLAL